MKRKHVVVLTGAGVSADSGLETFRDSDGLWAKHRIEDVCTPEALQRNPKLVLDFYNARRRQLSSVEPNKGHLALAELEKFYDVDIITQNVDNLHERAGSTKVLHLHGELFKARDILNPGIIVDIEGDINIGDTSPAGNQLRPHIVFFGESVPLLEVAAEIVSVADVFVVAGTSLAVYPAASLINYAPSSAELYLVDPSDLTLRGREVNYIRKRGAIGLPELCELLMSKQ